MSDYMKSEARAESMRAARNKYDKLNTRFYGLKLNIATDIELIQLLDQAKNKQKIIKEALQLYLYESKYPAIMQKKIDQHKNLRSSGD